MSDTVSRLAKDKKEQEVKVGDKWACSCGWVNQMQNMQCGGGNKGYGCGLPLCFGEEKASGLVVVHSPLLPPSSPSQPASGADLRQEHPRGAESLGPEPQPPTSSRDPLTSDQGSLASD